MPATSSKLLQGEESRRRLLESAVQLVATGGYAGTGVEAIAQRAGVGKSALYWHFGSKRGLLLEAIRVETERWVGEAFGATRAAGSPLGRLDALFVRVEGAIVDRSRAHRLLLALLLELGADDEEVRNQIADVFAVTRRALADGLCDSVPGLNARTADDIAAAFTAQVDGMFLRYLAEPDEERLERGMRTLREMMLMAIDNDLNRGVIES